MILVRYAVALAWLLLLILLMIAGGAVMVVIAICGVVVEAAAKMWRHIAPLLTMGILARLSCVLALCGVAGSASLPDTFAQRAMAHERPWNLFIRRLAGCPDYGDVSRRVCTLGSRIDLEQFRKSCETARALWALKGDCK